MRSLVLAVYLYGSSSVEGLSVHVPAHPSPITMVRDVEPLTMTPPHSSHPFPPFCSFWQTSLHRLPRIFSKSLNTPSRLRPGLEPSSYHLLNFVSRPSSRAEILKMSFSPYPFHSLSSSHALILLSVADFLLSAASGLV